MPSRLSWGIGRAATLLKTLLQYVGNTGFRDNRSTLNTKTGFKKNYVDNSGDDDGSDAWWIKCLCTDKPKWQHRSVRKFGAAVGDRCQLSCIVHSNPQPPMFYWVDKSGTNMSISSSYSIFSSENSSILTLASVRQADYGNFACIASNMVGSSRFQLSLLPPGTCLHYFLGTCYKGYSIRCVSSQSQVSNGSQRAYNLMLRVPVPRWTSRSGWHLLLVVRAKDTGRLDQNVVFTVVQYNNPCPISLILLKDALVQRHKPILNMVWMGKCRYSYSKAKLANVITDKPPVLIESGASFRSFMIPLSLTRVVLSIHTSSTSTTTTTSTQVVSTSTSIQVVSTSTSTQVVSTSTSTQVVSTSTQVVSTSTQVVSTSTSTQVGSKYKYKYWGSKYEYKYPGSK